MSRSEIVDAVRESCDEYLIPDLINIVVEYIYVVPNKCVLTLNNGSISKKVIEIDDNRIVSIFDDIIEVWSLKTGEPIKSIVCGVNIDLTDLIQLKYSKYGEIFASVDHECIKTWNNKYENVKTINTSQVFNIIEMNENIFVCLDKYAANIEIWNRRTCKFIKSINGHGSWSVYTLLKINDRIIVGGLSNHNILIYDVVDLQCKNWLYAEDSTYGLVINKDLQLISISSQDNSSQIWDFKDNNYVESKSNIKETTSDEKWPIYSHDHDGTLMLQQQNLANIVNNIIEIGIPPFIILRGHDVEIKYIMELKNGRLVSCDYAGIIKIWE